MNDKEEYVLDDAEGGMERSLLCESDRDLLLLSELVDMDSFGFAGRPPACSSG